VALPEDYWTSYEHRTDTLAAFFEAVQMISAYQLELNARFVWRGVGDATCALYSSLAREYLKRYPTLSDEGDLRQFEREIIEEARGWGLDWHSGGGRLAALELLAALQHYGVPTRLLDFTYNPFIALWFAVQGDDAIDGRVFAIDISPRLVSRDQAIRPNPWWLDEEPSATSPWTTESWVWRPPPLEARMVRQEACFLIGGLPSTVPPRNVKIEGEWRLLRTDEIRTCMSLPVRLVSYKQAVAASRGSRLRGTTPTARAFTLRIGAKPTLRKELGQVLGLSRRALFPDFAGFAEYGPYA